MVEAREGETLDELLRGKIRVLQPARGARVSLDALLLADFAGRRPAPGRRVLDLGCGTGVIGLALCARDPDSHVVAIEISNKMADLARRNASLNGVADRFEVLEADLRTLGLPPESFDLIVANPPYREEGTGRIPQGEERALARQELGCSLPDVVTAARRFAKPRGRAAIVFPAERLADLVAALVDADLRPRRLRAVHSLAGEPARRVLVEGVRAYRGGIEVQPPLVIHGPDRRGYTPEAAAILGD